MKYFLGIEFAQNPTIIYLCKRKYTLEIISEAGLSGTKPSSIPIELIHNLAKASDPLFDMSIHYCRLVEKLIYLTITLQNWPILFIYWPRSCRLLAKHIGMPLFALFDISKDICGKVFF